MQQLRTILLYANLGLSGPELQLVIAEADRNADGNIDVRQTMRTVSTSSYLLRIAPNLSS